ncbi:MAG: DUF2911 domain-containing protein [Bacteroidetes bacterium]|nr:DUF2911 domain-containing protein [Bacteroidota bacterium]
MKKMVTLALLAGSVAFSFTATAQGGTDKSKRPSPPALVKETLNNGAVISIDYSQPSVKGRTIGQDLEPKAGEVWRTGANEATVFETSKDLKIGDKTLPAGKYGLFSLSGDKNWTIIFNKTWKQWGAFNYKEADDALRITATKSKAEPFAEKMTFTIDKNGTITLLWGDNKISFTVQ